jgi:hypothetical protein
MSDRRSALFFMHNYNDIDHFTPVVDGLMRTGGWDCKMVFYPAHTLGSVTIETDWRLCYLRDTWGVEVHNIQDIDPSFKRSLSLLDFRQILTKACDATPPIGKLAGRDLRGLLPWFLAWRYYDSILNLWFKKLSPTGKQLWNWFAPDVIVIDWGRAHLLLHPILQIAKEKGVRILQLPHGAWTYEGIYSHASQFDEAKLCKKGRTPYSDPDAMVIDNLYKGMRTLCQGLRPKQLRFLGLARFTPQWLKTVISMPRASVKLAPTGKPRVVWFTTWLMACDRQGVIDSLAVLERYADRLDIILKVHTRNPAHEVNDYGSLLLPGSKIRVIANEEDSLAMTAWADAILITQSSIVYDAFVLGKPVLYLQYTLDFTCMWEVDGAGETLSNTQALDRCLAALADGAYQPSYSPADVDRYLSLAVYGGLPAAGVADAYADLFDQAASGAPLTAGLSYQETWDLWQEKQRPVAPEAVLALQKMGQPLPQGAVGKD